MQFCQNAKFQAENAEPIKFALCLKITVPIFSYPCSTIAYILDKHIHANMPFYHKNHDLRIFVANFFIAIYALFPPGGLDPCPDGLGHFFR